MLQIIQNSISRYYLQISRVQTLVFECGSTKYTQMNPFLKPVELNQTVLWLHFSNRFWTERNCVWCRMVQKSVITIKIWFHLLKFTKRFIYRLPSYIEINAIYFSWIFRTPKSFQMCFHKGNHSKCVFTRENIPNVFSQGKPFQMGFHKGYHSKCIDCHKRNHSKWVFTRETIPNGFSQGKPFQMYRLS